MELGALIAFYRRAPFIVDEYEKRRSLVNDQRQLLDIAESPLQVEILTLWITNNVIYLSDKLEEYERAKHILTHKLTIEEIIAHGHSGDVGKATEMPPG
jgi:hypothetical protein